MTGSEIAQAKARANDCVNGFMQVRMQQARDVVKLAEALQAANRIIECVRHTSSTDNKVKPGAPDFFNEIFGKKP